jgi:hypothetical protein
MHVAEARRVARQLKRADMGTIIEFPAGRRVSASGDVAPRADMGTILILPVIRIERESDEPSGDHGPEQGTAPGRRRRRR